MKKYIVKLVFNISIDSGKNNHQFDEQVRIINAANHTDALKKAAIIGKQEEVSFVDQENKIIKWQFINVSEMYELDNLKDGDQIYSSTIDTPFPNELIEFINNKSKEYLNNFLICD
ncbi:MAG: DUF4288 domain-containing protein [Bacteroidetes bacterium]|nr:DUF4288 domain-containing protein [Bacteroidota bacterium]